MFFLWHATPIYLHYFIIVLPAPVIVAGVAFDRVLAAIPRPLAASRPRLASLARGGLWMGLALTAFFQVWAWLSLLNFLGVTPTPGGFGEPLASKVEAADLARQTMLANNAAEVLVVGEGESPQLDEFPAEFDVLLRDLPHRFVDVRRSALFPAETAIVILDGQHASPVWAGDLYREAAVAVEEVPLRAPGASLSVLLVPGGSKPEPQVASNPPALLANFVNLLGHDALLRVDDESGSWQVHWRTADNPDPGQYHFFNHLLDASGDRVGQADAAVFSPSQWRAGDSVISRFLLPWPAAATMPLSMRVGMYRFPSLENVPLLDVAGNPYIDAATFPLDNLLADYQR
jgi:hypothetical protein